MAGDLGKDTEGKVKVGTEAYTCNRKQRIIKKQRNKEFKEQRKKM